MSEKTKQDGVDYLFNMANIGGVGIVSVDDGYVLMFKREKLKEMLDAYADKQFFVIQVKRPTFTN